MPSTMPGMQNPTPLFMALAELSASGAIRPDKVQVLFCGFNANVNVANSGSMSLDGVFGAMVDSRQIRKLPVPTKVVPVGVVLARVDGANATHLQRFGYLRQVGQLPQLWSYGITVTPAGVGLNSDAAQLDEAVASILASRETNEADIVRSQ